MPLNHFGKIAAAEVAFYFPVLCAAFFVTLRKGFRRREGWIFLVTFCMIRITGACITLASQLETRPSTGLFIAVTVLQGVGIASLLLATMGFVSVIARNASSSDTRLVRIGRLIRVILLVGIILRIVGSTEQTPNNDVSTISQGRTLTKVGIILLLVAYVGLLALHVLLWAEKDRILLEHQNLLLGISLALPPLFVRILYALFGAFANSAQSKWSPLTGSWGIYLVMGLIMEYLVVCVYVITGVFASTDSDTVSKVRYTPFSATMLGDRSHGRNDPL